MKDLYVIVVMYNENCDESISCNALLNIKIPFNVIVVDNSTVFNNNNVFCKTNMWEYITMKGNMGISKAYNKAINSINLKDCWVVLMDQDTYISSDYFQRLNELIIKNPEVWIKVPIVKDKSQYLSPSLIGKYSVKRIKNIETTINNRNLTAINSGMAIYSKVFEKINYDERFFLDYIDHNFIREYKAKFNCNIDIINSTLEQSFSDDKHNNISSDKTRFKIYLQDFKLFCDIDSFGRFYFIAKVLYRALKLSIIYRNFVFLSMATGKKSL